MWTKHEFIEELYKEQTNVNDKPFNVEWKEQVTEQFHRAVGKFKSSEPLNPTILSTVMKEGYTRYSIEITTLPKLTMQMYLLVPDELNQQQANLVLALHGHGYGNKDVVGLNADGSEKEEQSGYHQDFAVSLVQKGLIVAVPELIGFGDRRYAPDQEPVKDSDSSCYSIAKQLLLFGKTIAGLRIFECQKVLDYLESRDDFQIGKIGCMGISGGGLVAAFTSIVDQRISATVISGYTSTFKGSIMDRRHCLDNYIPGILQIAELPEIIGLLAPRPLFIESGIHDDLFKEPDVKVAEKRIRSIYQAFDSEENVSAHYFDGGHEISGEYSFDWLDKNLSGK